MLDFDVVIKNGLIFDGTRVPRYRGDIGIRDGVIAGEVPGCRTVAGSVATKALEEQFMHIAAGEREKVA